MNPRKYLDDSWRRNAVEQRESGLLQTSPLKSEDMRILRTCGSLRHRAAQLPVCRYKIKDIMNAAVGWLAE